MPHPEPRFARIAATIGDPTRARMLAALMGGRYLSAGELAQAAGVTAQTASSHIARLVDHELVQVRVQGRHRYFKLADAEIAHALEALSVVAERSAEADKWARGPYRPLKAARSCYGHLAGELGVRLFEGLLARGTLRPSEGGFSLSEEGAAELQALGVELPPASRRYAYPCLDWSERRDHLAGSLAVALLDHALAQGLVRRVNDSRVLTLTPAGQKAWSPWLDQRSMVSVASKPVGGGGLRERQAL
jgi:DNA-binding transcriptional ArsR family regulator